MKTAFVLTLTVLIGYAFGDDPVEVNPELGATLSKLDLSGTLLTTSYCAISGYECAGIDIEQQQFAPSVSQCLSRCSRDLGCFTAFFDKDKICHLRGKRCDKADLKSNAGGMDLFRLQLKESCPTDRPKYAEPNYNFGNKFCKLANKACTGHNLYDKPQKIFPMEQCLQKCAKITNCHGVDFYGQYCEPKEYQCTDAQLTSKPGTDNYLRLTKDATGCAGNRVDTSKIPETTDALPEQCTNAVNKALKTYESSVGWDGNPERAVDGNPDGNYFHNSCSHTDIENQPWWYADLCRQVTLYGVMITNRDSYQDRLTSVDVGVTNYQPPEAFPESDRAVFRVGAFTGTIKLKFKQPKKGRFLVIVLRKQDYLTLCEVQWVTSDADLNGFINGDDVVDVQQSSIGWIGNPGRAVDGNTDGNYADLSCCHTLNDVEPWWYVQFPSEITIYGVMISNRDSFQPRLSSFEVAVTNSVPPQNYPSSDVGVHRIQPFIGTLKLKLTPPKKGRYLVVKLRKQDYLTLCEVQWVTSAAQLSGFIDGDNLVRVKQSSIGWDGNPERAVDGNTDSDYSHNSCSHTLADNPPWWYVEFVTEVKIYGVMISNRDSYQSRLSRIAVAVTNNNPPEKYPDSDIAVLREKLFSGTLKLKFREPKSGRYLVVSLRKQEYLTLCEVQWVTSAAQLSGFIDGDDAIDAKQSSIGWDGYPARAVDGNTDGNFADLSCCHTLNDIEPWWYAQFLSQLTIFGVMISNRDSYLPRLSSFEVAVTNSAPPQNYPSSDVGVHRIQPFTGTLKLKLTSPKTGRYLVVKLRKQDFLTLCEVQWVTSSAQLSGFIDGDNLVRVKQSNIGWDGNPERAVDGNTDSDYSHNSCAHTLADNPPWWYVEFVTEVKIYGVMIANRDSYQSRLSRIEVAVTSNNPPENFPDGDLGVYREKEFTGILKLKFREPKFGRYLVVRLRKQEYLTLCEVQWVTSAAQLSGFIDGDDVIDAKQSSIGWDGYPARAVDGIIDGNFAHLSCCHTLNDAEPWWYVQFSYRVTVFGVMISNRDSFQYRLTNFEVAVTDNQPPQNYGRGDVGAYRVAQFTGTLNLKFQKSKIGRYLVVKMRKQEYLTLCEVRWVTTAAESTNFVESDTIPAS